MVNTKDAVAADIVPASAALPEIRRMMNKLSLEATVEANTENTAELQLSILENILAAENVDDVFKAQEAGLTSSKDFVNTPFSLVSDNITWVKSRFTGEHQFPFYARIDAQLEDGDMVAVGTGGVSCVGVLARLQELGYLDEPRKLMFTEKATASGYNVILLKPVQVSRATNTRGEKK